MESRIRKKRISAAYRYCFSGLVLQLWLYCEERLEDGPQLSSRETAVGEELMGIIRRFLEKEDQPGRAKAFQQLKSLRDRVIGRVEILTAFSDCFQIYEYVLNRVERRFVKRKDSEYTPKELVSELMETMASMEDAASRNGWLRDLVAQLPVRFTRKKFYAMVMERFTSYVGLGKGSVEDYLYMLKSSVMLSLPEGMDQEEELFLHLERLRGTDYKNLDRTGFEKCVEALEKGSRLLTEKTDYYLSVEQMVNDLYVLFLTEGERMTDAVEEMDFCKGAAHILEALENRDKTLLREDILTNMEGIQESVMELVMAKGPERDEVLDKVDRLVSGSFFMPVEPGTVREEEADRQWIDSKAAKLCQELDGMFANSQKAVARAVMAKVISSLPMVFRDSRQVEEYMASSLESCTDFAEREASMELLEQSLREQRLMDNVLV